MAGGDDTDDRLREPWPIWSATRGGAVAGVADAGEMVSSGAAASGTGTLAMTKSWPTAEGCERWPLVRMATGRVPGKSVVGNHPASPACSWVALSATPCVTEGRFTAADSP